MNKPAKAALMGDLAKLISSYRPRRSLADSKKFVQSILQACKDSRSGKVHVIVIWSETPVGLDAEDTFSGVASDYVRVGLSYDRYTRPALYQDISPRTFKTRWLNIGQLVMGLRDVLKKYSLLELG